VAGSRPGAAVRADQLAVDLGLARSRAEAQALILAGAIHLESDASRRLTAGQRVDPDARLVRDAGPGWASRGAEKLVAALDVFEVAVEGLTCLDAGASTGGFTDVLLRRGASRVYALDVGRGQLLPRLAADERVVVMDRTNLRTLTALPETVDLATLDLSFISLRLVLGAVHRVLASDGQVIALVKPQFEAGRPDVPRGGVVRDPDVHRRVLRRFAADARGAGLAPVGLIASPRTGREGNREFLALLRPAAAPEDGHPRGGGAWDKMVDEALA
jgi:23S rRNA (cytidine1920-2'-O)/16S rRNA (cytidine1409-2'-O)-methyltransferase